MDVLIEFPYELNEILYDHIINNIPVFNIEPNYVKKHIDIKNILSLLQALGKIYIDRFKKDYKTRDLYINLYTKIGDIMLLQFPNRLEFIKIEQINKNKRNLNNISYDIIVSCIQKDIKFIKIENDYIIENRPVTNIDNTWKKSDIKGKHARHKINILSLVGFNFKSVNRKNGLMTMTRILQEEYSYSSCYKYSRATMLPV